MIMTKDKLIINLFVQMSQIKELIIQFNNTLKLLDPDYDEDDEDDQEV